MSALLHFSENIADAEAPAQLPPGEYRATCVKAEAGTSKSSGNPQITLRFRVDRSEFPPDFETDEASLEFLFYRTARDSKSDRFKVRELCENLGVPMSNTIDPNDFMMKDCRIKISMGQDLEGNPQARIDKVLAL